MRLFMPRRAFLRDTLDQFGDFEALEAYRDDPVAFARDKIRIEPWKRQAEIIDAVAKHDRVTVRSGHKIGKSLAAIVLALWFVATRGPRSAVLMTAPTRRQVFDPLWKEVGFLYPRVRHELKGPVSPPRDPATGLRLPGMRTIKGVTGSTPESMAGISAPELLFIIDEASGFADELWEVIIGNMAGGAKIVAFSNPTRPVGWWADACRSDEWHNIHVSSLESPNITGEGPRIKGLAGHKWLAWLRAECGENYEQHPTYLVRALGEFPEKAFNQVIATTHVDEARKRWRPEVDLDNHEPLRVGVDPSGHGPDDAVIQPVRGPYAYAPEVLRGEVEPEDIAERVVHVIAQHREPWDHAVPVNIDAASLGLGTVAALRAHKRHGVDFVAVPINGGTKAEPDREDHDANMRTQLWFQLATWMRTGALPPLPKLRQELITQTYMFDPYSRQLATPKPTIRKLLKRSPNHADALTLAVHESPVVEPEYIAELPEDEEHEELW